MTEMEEYRVRRYLWLTHDPKHFGGLYGDDGEMQCSHMSHGIIDFQRDSITKILDVLGISNE